MISLLQELALLKQLDGGHQGDAGSAAEASDFETRQNRRREITELIKALGNPPS